MEMASPIEANVYGCDLGGNLQSVASCCVRSDSDAELLSIVGDNDSGPGCRDPSYLRRDEVPSSGLASLDTSERNYWVALVPRIIHTSHVRLSL